jgi:hypothetical protein
LSDLSFIGRDIAFDFTAMTFQEFLMSSSQDTERQSLFTDVFGTHTIAAAGRAFQKLTRIIGSQSELETVKEM